MSLSGLGFTTAHVLCQKISTTSLLAKSRLDSELPQARPQLLQMQNFMWPRFDVFFDGICRVLKVWWFWV